MSESIHTSRTPGAESRAFCPTKGLSLLVAFLVAGIESNALVIESPAGMLKYS